MIEEKINNSLKELEQGLREIESAENKWKRLLVHMTVLQRQLVIT